MRLQVFFLFGVLQAVHTSGAYDSQPVRAFLLLMIQMRVLIGVE